MLFVLGWTKLIVRVCTRAMKGIKISMTGKNQDAKALPSPCRGGVDMVEAVGAVDLAITALRRPLQRLEE